MQFSVLGTLEVTDGQIDRTPSAPKLRQVLALFLARNNQVVPIQELIDELWVAQPPRSALSTLQTYIYKLRKIFDQASMGSGEEILRTKNHGYILNIPEDDVDLCHFDRLAERGRAAMARGNPSEATETFAEALNLWRGSAFVDVTAGEVLSAELTRLEEGRLRALDLRLEAALQLGRHSSLISELKGLAAKYPLHEGFQGKLMLALYRAGRRCEALDVYQRVREYLVEELGVDPSPALGKLHQGLLACDSSLDLSQEPVDNSPTNTESLAGPEQLPPDAAGHAGRVEELDRAAGTLVCSPKESGAVGIVSVTGMPGVGKTAFSVRAAHRVRSYFPDGQLFMNLNGSTGQPADPADILGSLLESCGFSSSRIPVGIEARSKLFRTWSANRRILLVLDDAVSRAQVLPLLPNSTSCAVLVTSRSHAVSGTVTIPLDVLSSDEGLRVLANMIGEARVQAAPDAAREIVKMCGYLPLALHVIGTRLAAVPSWPLSGVVTRLADRGTRLDQLRLDDLDVRGSYDTLYADLKPEIQTLFPWLSLLPSEGFNVNDVMSLLGGDITWTESFLLQLVENHLLHTVKKKDGQNQYYVFPELSYIYAEELLESMAQVGA